MARLHSSLASLLRTGVPFKSRGLMKIPVLIHICIYTCFSHLNQGEMQKYVSRTYLSAFILVWEEGREWEDFFLRVWQVFCKFKTNNQGLGKLKTLVDFGPLPSHSAQLWAQSLVTYFHFWEEKVIFYACPRDHPSLWLGAALLSEHGQTSLRTKRARDESFEMPEVRSCSGYYKSRLTPPAFVESLRVYVRINDSRI